MNLSTDYRFLTYLYRCSRLKSRLCSNPYHQQGRKIKGSSIIFFTRPHYPPVIINYQYILSIPLHASVAHPLLSNFSNSPSVNRTVGVLKVPGTLLAQTVPISYKHIHFSASIRVLFLAIYYPLLLRDRCVLCD